MTDLDSSKHNKINSCYSRRLEEVFTEDYPRETQKEQKRKQGKGESQIQNQEQTSGSEIQSLESDGEDLLSKIKTRIQDCGLNQTHSKRIEGT
jgi:hypothetical protein